jgi:hypothetical protein
MTNHEAAQPVEAVAMASASGAVASAEVVRVDYAMHRLEVTVRSATHGTSVKIGFGEVAAYRVMDERDFGEYWPACASPDGLLFQIRSGGWLAKERVRPGSCIAFHGDLREYLVAGITDCVCVLCAAEPTIEPYQGVA